MVFGMKEEQSFLDGKTTYFYEENAPAEIIEPFKIKVSKKGIEIFGTLSPIFNERQLETFANVMAQAWKAYDKIRVKIVLPGGETS